MSARPAVRVCSKVGMMTCSAVAGVRKVSDQVCTASPIWARVPSPNQSEAKPAPATSPSSSGGRESSRKKAASAARPVAR
jgi:hypothetical protein